MLYCMLPLCAISLLSTLYTYYAPPSLSAGCAESPVLRSLKYPDGRAKRCFSIVSNTDKIYDFEAASIEDQDKWVRGLFSILKYDT
jgi:hypothetical protein